MLKLKLELITTEKRGLENVSFQKLDKQFNLMVRFTENGKVFQVKHKSSGDVRACKQLQIKQIQNYSKFMLEINILSKILTKPSVA